VTQVLVTGMSGTGKSTALVELARRGHTTVDTDTDEWSVMVVDEDGEPDWVWRVDAMTTLLTTPRSGALVVSGCKTNQGRLYGLFDHVVLLSAPADVLLDRVSARENNPYGRTPDQRDRILRHLTDVEPRLRASASGEVDATLSVVAVADEIERICGLR
jgi:dephospho-CoA kinase